MHKISMSTCISTGSQLCQGGGLFGVAMAEGTKLPLARALVEHNDISKIFQKPSERDHSVIIVLDTMWSAKETTRVGEKK